MSSEKRYIYLPEYEIKISKLNITSSQNLMSSSQYFVRTPSRRFPTRSDSTDDFLLAAAESGLSPSRGTSPSNTHRRQVAFIRMHDNAYTDNCMKIFFIILTS